MKQELKTRKTRIFIVYLCKFELSLFDLHENQLYIEETVHHQRRAARKNKLTYLFCAEESLIAQKGV